MTARRSTSNSSDAPLQEQHPEDVLLELRGIHLPAQDVGGREEVALELREGQHDGFLRPAVRQRRGIPRYSPSRSSRFIRKR